VWTCFVTAMVSITRNRYATYGIGLLALIATGWAQGRNKMNWAFNWDLWNAVRWSDMGPFQMDRPALVLNRLLVLSLAAFFVVVAVRFHGRRDADPVRIIHRLRPRALWGTALGLAPYALLPAVFGTTLGVMVAKGSESDAAKKKAHDYWKQNLATWKDARQPEIVDVDLTLKLDPPKSHFETAGRFTLSNPYDTPLKRFALTGGFHWSDVNWTMNGKEYKPENRTSLFAFTPETPIDPGGTVDVGFTFRGDFPKGSSKNGGGSMEFILPSGAVLTAFGPAFVPIVGYDEQLGIEEGTAARRGHPDDFYVGRTDPAFGRIGVHRACHGVGPSRVPLQLDRHPRIRHGQGRRTHRGLEDRPQGADVQRRRREMGRAEGRRDRDLLRPPAHLQHRRAHARAERCTQVLLPLVP
jgi:hypothetical protein